MILLVTFGGFLTNAVYCLRENLKHHTGREYFAVKGRQFAVNLFFCALAGVLWYSQFFGLEMLPESYLSIYCRNQLMW